MQINADNMKNKYIKISTSATLQLISIEFLFLEKNLIFFQIQGLLSHRGVPCTQLYFIQFIKANNT